MGAAVNAGQWIALIVVAALTVAVVVVIADECRYGRRWKHGTFADETRRYTATDNDEPFDDLRFRRETDLALALLQPDSEQLPAEEANS
jgi:hypothetical protein